MRLPEVLKCYIMLGDCDAMIRVQAADIAEQRRFQSKSSSRIRSVRNARSDAPRRMFTTTA